MLVVSKFQMEMLASVIDRRFCERLAIDLRRRYATTFFYSNENLLVLIQSGVERARSYGLSWESSIADFVGLMFDVGLKFDRHPKIHFLLTDEKTEPNLRIKLLMEKLSNYEWQEVRSGAQF